MGVNSYCQFDNLLFLLCGFVRRPFVYHESMGRAFNLRLSCLTLEGARLMSQRSPAGMPAKTSRCTIAAASFVSGLPTSLSNRIPPPPHPPLPLHFSALIVKRNAVNDTLRSLFLSQPDAPIPLFCCRFVGPVPDGDCERYWE